MERKEVEKKVVKSDSYKVKDKNTKAQWMHLKDVSKVSKMP